MREAADTLEQVWALQRPAARPLLLTAQQRSEKREITASPEELTRWVGQEASGAVVNSPSGAEQHFLSLCISE